MSWMNGGINAIPVTNIANGGPAGAGDSYIRLTADGSGSGGRLTAFNNTQWLGDYIAEGVTAIEVDLINLSSVSLSVRLAFKTGPGNVPGYVSLPMLLPVGSGWQHFTISLAPANMRAIGGPAPYNTFFAAGGVGEMRFIHAVGNNTLSGDFVVGQLGIDNIRAVPEPATTALMVGGILALLGVLVRHKRHAR